MLLDKGADPKFVHHTTYVGEAGFGQADHDESFPHLWLPRACCERTPG